MSSYLALRKRFQSKGFTLVEMMVVVALIGFLSAISVSLISLLFQSNIRAAQSANQQNNIEVFYGFLASKLSYVDKSDMGIRPPGAIGDEVMADSLASDQMLFTYRDDLSGAATCYRLMYFRQAQEIRLASVTGSCQGSVLVPKRRPNQSFSGSKSEDGFATPGNTQFFDPAIDSASEEWSDWVSRPVSEGGIGGTESVINSFVVASGIRDGSGYDDTDNNTQNNWPSSYPEKYKNPQSDQYEEYLAGMISVFSYFKDNSKLSPPSGGLLDTKGLNSVRVKSFSSAAASASESAIIPDRFYEQRFFIDQLCPIPGQAGEEETGSQPLALDDLPKAPGVALSFSGAAANTPAIFEQGGDSLLFENGPSSFWDADEPEQIVIPRNGIYTISANVCFPDEENAAFEVFRFNESEPLLAFAGRFIGAMPQDERCLSAARTVYLGANTEIGLRVTFAGEPTAKGNISLIWESAK